MRNNAYLRGIIDNSLQLVQTSSPRCKAHLTRKHGVKSTVKSEKRKTEARPHLDL
ncbi:hypothetical protein DPMN_014702 [Dreissena polymorpha]|uniref:Uncharacterized protein n=1 Tax=Dreissena polymorpha TaxID=45954 RepID=A0A9D4N6H6_DREPO|nr:hypothetical protein DPMN_014702 [Dreissena polymorpha]